MKNTVTLRYPCVLNHVTLASKLQYSPVPVLSSEKGELGGESHWNHMQVCMMVDTNTTTHLDPLSVLIRRLLPPLAEPTILMPTADPLHHARFVRLEEYGAIPGPCQMPGSYADATRQSGMEVSELWWKGFQPNHVWAFSESGGTRAYVTNGRISMVSR